MRTKVLALTLAVATLLVASPARAHDLAPMLREHDDLPEVERLEVLHRRLHRMLDRYLELERAAGRRWIEVVEAEREVALATASADAAEVELAERVRTAYQVGPGGALEALLGAGSLSDVAAISTYLGRTIELDHELVRETVVAEAVSVARRAAAEGARASLEPRLEQLRALMRRIRHAFEEAAPIAREAAVAEELEAQQRAIAEAAARMGTWDIIGYRDDQSHLLALLGPAGGRTCDTPAGLVPTGEVFEGYASWYGWEFGGQPTATGAIFDPRLFTAANRWLPFGTFLRVHHGDRCAIVLVNDRGPYGRLERVIDLSMASAQYLGVGVSWVRAEILVPTDAVG